MRVASFFSNQLSLTQLQKSNARLGDLTFQISSGLKARRFEDMATEANTLLNLKDVRANTNTYIENIDSAQSRLRAMEGALQAMVDIVVEAANVWTLGRNENAPDVRATMAPKAEGLTESFYELMKTRFDGRYLFSGQASGTIPISGTPVANTFPGDPPPTTYYTGDTELLQVVTANTSVQQYGVTGDELGFARLKAGLEALWFGLENNSEADLDGAIDLLNQAQSDLSDLLGTVGGQLSGMNVIKDRHESNLSFMQERIDVLEKVDVTEAISLFTQEQAVLEASMLTLTQSNQLTLLDFIR